MEATQFIRRLHIQFPEDLPEGLDDLVVKQIFLESRPLAGSVEMEGMGNDQLSMPVQSIQRFAAEESKGIISIEHQFRYNGRNNRVLRQIPQFGQCEGSAIFHCLLEHPPCAAVLLRQLLFHINQAQHIGIFLYLGRQGFQLFTILEAKDLRAALIVNLQTEHPFLNLVVTEEIAVFFHQFGFHPQGQTHGIREAGVGSKISQCSFHRLLFAGRALCAEVTAFLQELLQEEIAMGKVCVFFQRNDGIGHQQILVPLFLDFCFRF